MRWPACSEPSRSLSPPWAALFFGAIADRFGRARALIFTILLFSLGSLGAATSQTLTQLLLWRALLGLGMGGEWASGAALVSESWPAEHRTKAISIMQSGWALGYILAAIAAAVVLDVLALGPEAWRWLFVVGALPALFTLWVRRRVPESPIWLKHETSGAPRANPFAMLFGPRLWRRTVLATLLTGSVHVRQLGTVLLAADISRHAHRAGRRRHDHPALDELDHPDAGRLLPRLPVVRIHRGPHRTAAGIHPLHVSGGGAGADLRPARAQPECADAARAVDRLRGLRLLQHVRRRSSPSCSRPRCARPARGSPTTSAGDSAPSRHSRSA